jgi:hypothetical protein
MTRMQRRLQLYQQRQARYVYWRRRLVAVCILVVIFVPFLTPDSKSAPGGVPAAVDAVATAASIATNTYGARIAPCSKSLPGSCDKPKLKLPKLPTLTTQPSPSKPKARSQPPPTSPPPQPQPASCRPRVNPGIPQHMLSLYVQHAGCDWWVLAGVYRVESDHGQSSAPGVRSGRNRHGCCAGPGQFHMGGTAQRYGLDERTVYDPNYTVPASARLLRNNGMGTSLVGRCADVARLYGVPTGTANALWHYNNACWYVTRTLNAGRHYQYLAK